MQVASEIVPGRNSQMFSHFDNAFDDSGMSMATFIEKRFIPDHVEQKSPAGRTHYHSILKHVLRPETVDRLFMPYVRPMKARLRSLPDWPYLDDVRLCDLSPDHVRQLILSASARGYSPQTVKHIRNVISAVVSHARRERVFSHENPTPSVELPPMVRRTSPNLTIVQAKAILRTMKYPQREMALITMIVGMSISEICGLQWKCVNLTLETVYSDGEVIPPRCILVKRQRNSAGLVEVSPSRIRVVELPEPLYRKLLNLRRAQRSSDRDGFVIPSRPGTPLSPTCAQLLRLQADWARARDSGAVVAGPQTSP
jgi:integrase